MDTSDVEQSRLGYSLIMVLQALGLIWVSPDLAMEKAEAAKPATLDTVATAATPDLRALPVLDSASSGLSNLQMMEDSNLTDISIRIKLLCHHAFPGILKMFIMTKRVVQNEVAARCIPQVSQYGGVKFAKGIVSTSATAAATASAPTPAISGVMDRCENMTRAWQQTWGTLKSGKDEHLDSFLEQLEVELGIAAASHESKSRSNMLPFYVQPAALDFNPGPSEQEMQEVRQRSSSCPVLTSQTPNENLDLGKVVPVTSAPQFQPVIEYCGFPKFGELSILGVVGSTPLTSQGPSNLGSRRISRRKSHSKPVQKHIGYSGGKHPDAPCVDANHVSGKLQEGYEVIAKTNATDALPCLGLSAQLPCDARLDSPRENRASQISPSIPSELAALHLEDALIGDSFLFGAESAISLSDFPNETDSGALIAAEQEDLFNWNGFKDTGNTVEPESSPAATTAGGSSFPAILAEDLLKTLTHNPEEQREGFRESLITERSAAFPSGDKQVTVEPGMDETSLADLEGLLGDIEDRCLGEWPASFTNHC